MGAVEFDALLYREDAIWQAIRDYKEIADIHMWRQGNTFIIDIAEPQIDPEMVALEFGNYVLNLSVMAERKTES